MLPNGTLIHVAGNGVVGFGGDGGPAVNAAMKVHTMCVAPNGDLFFSDPLNRRVRKVDQNGMISTIAGSGAAGFAGDGSDARLAKLLPYGLSFQSNGVLLVAGTYYCNVVKY